jgi:hypothetical protein
VDKRLKAWVCGHSLAGIADLNSAGGMDICITGTEEWIYVSQVRRSGYMYHWYVGVDICIIGT